MTKFEKQDLLLLVWVHGFKGNDVTFESFPDRLCHLLSATHPTLRIESKVFPAYQTRGELTAATLAFVDWLTTLVVNLEVDHGAGGGAGKAKIVLLGHSMGGLLIADAARDIAKNTRAGEKLWPNIVAMVAFDTPYLGLHPHIFVRHSQVITRHILTGTDHIQKHGLTTAASYIDTARNVATVLSPIAIGLGFGKFGGGSAASPEAGPSGSSSRSTTPSGKGKEPAASSIVSGTAADSSSSTVAEKKSWWSSIPIPQSATGLYGLGAVALGAAAVGTAYYRREDFMNGWKFGYEHMTFVRNLWDEEGLKQRLIGIDGLDKDHNVRFWNFYTHLPATPPKHVMSRTFTILPPTTAPLFPRWQPQTNGLAPDEVTAHMNMFNPKTNDGFYELGLAVVRGIGERIEEEGVAASGTGATKLFDFDDSAGDPEGADRGEKDESMEGVEHSGTWREEKDEKGRTILVEM